MQSRDKWCINVPHSDDFGVYIALVIFKNITTLTELCPAWPSLACWWVPSTGVKGDNFFDNK